MDVGLYVSELLNELSEVSLPGIGTFYKKVQSAYFDERQKIFFPPTAVLDFKSSNNDASPELVNTICIARNISEPSARYFIDKYCETLRQSLQIKGYALIGELGKIKASEGVYTFEPTSLENVAYSYGLSPVTESIKTSSSDTPPDFSAIRTRTPERALPEDNVPLPEKQNRMAVLILLTLLFLGAGITALYFYYPQVFDFINRPASLNQPRTKKVIAAPKAKTLEDSLAKADSIMESSFTQLQDEGITVEKPRDTMNISTQAHTVRSDSVKLATSTRFEIICASFNKMSEAETSVKTLRKRGIDANIIIDTKKPLYKVSLGSFTNFEAANEERRRIQQQIAKDAWILTIKNK